MNKYLQEKQMLEEMIEWISHRIKELPEEKSIYYKDMKENLKWELKNDAQKLIEWSENEIAGYQSFLAECREKLKNMGKKMSEKRK